MKKTIAAVFAAAALGVTSQAWSAFGETFQVQESAIAGANANLITANNFNFNYSATFNQLVVGGSLGGVGDTFTENGNYNVGGIFFDNIPQPSQLNCLGLNCYGLLGSFNATGEADFFNGVDLSQGVLVTFATFNLDLFADTDQNGTGDTLLANAALVPGQGQAHVFAGLANGDFDIVALFTPTAAGSAYFVDPNPFYAIIEFNGVNTQITGLDPVNGGPGEIVGSGNAFFIPEPGMLGLLGLGLVTLALTRRRS